MRPVLLDWIRSLSDGERWFYGLAATVVVSIIVVGIMAPLVTHRLAVRRDRRAAERLAAATFRAAVLSALRGLYPLPFQWPDDITQTLRNAAPTLQSAVAQFRPFVPWWQRRAFDGAWFKYRCGTGREIDLQNYHHYIGFESNPDYKARFRRNVDALLSYAK
jgi:hypothetical protein